MRNVNEMNWNELRTAAKENGIKVTNKAQVIADLTSITTTTPITEPTMDLSTMGFNGVKVITTTIKVEPVITKPVYIHCVTNNNLYKVIGSTVKGTRNILQLAKREDVIAKKNLIHEIDETFIGKNYVYVTAAQVKEIVATRELATKNRPIASSHIEAEYIVNIDSKRNLSVYNRATKKIGKALPGESVQAFFKQCDTVIDGVKATITFEDVKPGQTPSMAPSVCVCEICKKREVTTASQSILKRYTTVLPTQFQGKAICYACQKENGIVNLIKNQPAV